MPHKPTDLRSRYKSDALLHPPRTSTSTPTSTSDSETSTVHGDPKKLLIRDATSKEREILEAQRYRLAWAEYDAVKHCERYREMIDDLDVSDEEFTGQENKHRISDQRYMDLRESVDNNKLVKLYNEANPRLNLQRLALRDSENMRRWDRNSPSTGQSVNDRFKQYMKETLPKWELTLHVPDDWSTVKVEVQNLILDWRNCTEHQNWALHPFREQHSADVKARQEKEERDKPQQLRTFAARTEELTKIIDVEKEIEKCKREDMRLSRTVEERQEMEKNWNNMLRLQGVGSRVDVGYIPVIDYSKGSYERKRVPILEEDRKAFPPL